MSVCYFQINYNNHSTKIKKEKYRIVDISTITCNIDKNKVKTIMASILSKYCNIKIYGYNKLKEQYWCKNVKENVCSLFINISLQSYNFNKTVLILTPMIGKDKEIKEFIEKFKEGLQLYQGSSFVRQYLD
jgi:hypothetical protein